MESKNSGAAYGLRPFTVPRARITADAVEWRLFTVTRDVPNVNVVELVNAKRHVREDI